MADSYIDYDEVSEYGNHFASEAKKLLGASPLVDVAKLVKLVAGDVAAVAAELEKAGAKRGGLRSTAIDVKALSAGTSATVEQFFRYLGSLDEGVVDVATYFDRGQLGRHANLKPADVRSKAQRALRGFAANPKLPGGAAWKKKLTDSEAALGAALDGKGEAASGSITKTADLVAAREKFLVSYNGVAKRLVLGLLTSLGREGEMGLFFKDLLVNERAPAKGKGKKGGAAPVVTPT